MNKNSLIINYSKYGNIGLGVLLALIRVIYPFCSFWFVFSLSSWWLFRWHKRTQYKCKSGANSISEKSCHKIRINIEQKLSNMHSPLYWWVWEWRPQKPERSSSMFLPSCQDYLSLSLSYLHLLYYIFLVQFLKYHHPINFIWKLFG